ncbi:MAG: hypothetical protein ACOX52_11460 [Verrucomicrobiota bacterium]
MVPTHPYGQVENVTAPSAGDSLDGEIRLGKRLPLWTTSTPTKKPRPDFRAW